MIIISAIKPRHKKYTKTPDDEIYAKLLRKKREELGLSMERLAGMTSGLSSKTLYNFETGKVKTLLIKKEIKEQIANILGESVEDLFEFMKVYIK